MANQKPKSGGQQKPTAPGKPASRQPPDSNTGKQKNRDEGQSIPKTGHENRDS
jgi:hypothetical protein